MIDLEKFDRRPLVVAIAGPNGAGKTTFYYSYWASAGLRFVNADVLADELGLQPYKAAEVATALRHELLRRGESFVFETVFSDPVGDKIAFLERAVRCGYEVLLCYIGLLSADQSVERVAIRVLQGGHAVPEEKLKSRFPRTLKNLRASILQLPHVFVFDNSDLALPFQRVAVFEYGKLSELWKPVSEWFRPLIEQ